MRSVGESFSEILALESSLLLFILFGAGLACDIIKHRYYTPSVPGLETEYFFYYVHWAIIVAMRVAVHGRGKNKGNDMLCGQAPAASLPLLRSSLVHHQGPSQ